MRLYNSLPNKPVTDSENSKTFNSPASVTRFSLQEILFNASIC